MQMFSFSRIFQPLQYYHSNMCSAFMIQLLRLTIITYWILVEPPSAANHNQCAGGCSGFPFQWPAVPESWTWAANVSSVTRHHNTTHWCFITATQILAELAVWLSGNGFHQQVTSHWARLIIGRVTVCLWANTPSRYVISHLGQLSLLPTMGW